MALRRRMLDVGPFAILLAALALLGLLLVLTVVGNRELVRIRGWVEHTIEVRQELATLLRTLDDAETGQRGYLLTGRREYLEPYDHARAGLVTASTRVRVLTADNPDQTARIDRVDQLARAKNQELDETVRLFSTGDRAGALALVETGKGKALMDELRGVIAAMDASEAALLHTRQARAEAAATKLYVLRLVTFALLALLAVLAWRLEQNARATRQALALAQVRANFDGLPLGLAQFDAAGLTYANDALSKMVGLPPDALHKPLVELFASGDGAPSRLEPLIHGEKDVATVEGRLACADGRALEVLVSAKRLRLADGQRPIVAAFEDVSRLRAEERAAELVRMGELRERFLAIVVHDLRSPLSAIGLGASVALRGNPPEPTMDALIRIHRTATRMAKLLDDLLDLARDRAGGGIPVAPESCDLREAVLDAVGETRAAYPEREVALEAPDACLGNFDRARMVQVVVNLVTNAIVHGAPGTPVRVSLRACQGAAVLEVTNDGSPIDAALMPHLFDPFRRGADATLPGLGLGLYIAHELVAAHDGSIEVDSGPRETTFRVRVPLTPDAKPASSEPRRVGLKRPRDTQRAS